MYDDSLFIYELVLGIILNILVGVIPFILIFILLKISSKSKKQNVNTLLSEVFEVQHFSNIKTSSFSDKKMSVIDASSHGENYIFGIRNNTLFLPGEIDLLHKLSEKEHIHNVIIVTSSENFIPSNTLVKIKNYGMEIWNTEKLNSLLNENISTLKTSDTSDDTCDIDENKDDPIDNSPKVNTFLGGLFNKPDRL